MLFNSISFLIFLFLTAIIYYLIPQRFKWYVLLVASVYFYLSWNPLHIVVLLAVTAISYFTGRCVYQAKDSANKKRLCLSAGIVLSFIFLVVCKYAGFFNDMLCSALDALHVSYQKATLDIALPVGISFFSFKAVSYIMDAYRGKIVEKNFLKYLLYVSFFPQVASGPIERSTNLIPELSREHKFSTENVQHALFFMLTGYFKKMVVADNLSAVVGRVFSDPTLYSPLVLLGIACVYSIQILCDFSGYSDIAIGCAKLFGINTAKNFDHPYFSSSIGTFWRRWHISLSSWFRDYLYIPLGGNRKGAVRKYVNLAIVFLVSGLWHGSAWTFVFWGLLHALYQIIGALTQGLRQKFTAAIRLDRHEKLHKVIQMVITFLLVSFAWIFFRAETVSGGFDYIKSMLTLNADAFSFGSLIAQVKMLFTEKTTLFSFVLAVLVFLPYEFIDYRKDIYHSLSKKGTLAKVLFYVFFVTIVLLFACTSATDFIYSRF